MKKYLSIFIAAFILIFSAIFYGQNERVNYSFVVLDETTHEVDLLVSANKSPIYGQNFEAGPIEILPGPTYTFEEVLPDSFYMEVEAEGLNDAFKDVEASKGTFILIYLSNDSTFIEQSEESFLFN